MEIIAKKSKNRIITNDFEFIKFSTNFQQFQQSSFIRIITGYFWHILSYQQITNKTINKIYIALFLIISGFYKILNEL